MSYENLTVHPTIYKQDSKGVIRQWNIEIGYNNDDDAGYRVVAGILNGKLVTSEWKVAEPKNVGRANATTALEQACAEAMSEYVKKLDRGYFKNIEDVGNFEKVKPMLAKEYKPLKDYSNVHSQPKLDGIRCIARADGLWSRAGKEIVAVPHIMKDLEYFFRMNPGAVLDGELYNHDLKDDFNKITSLVRKTKPTDADLEESKQLVQYHVYDMVDPNMKFSARFGELWVNTDMGESIKLVPTQKVESQEELDTLYGAYLEDGYEGQMVRIDEKYQENKRSKYLLKRKEFITEEYAVVGVSEGQGNWSGAIKRFHLIQGDGYPFDAGVRGSYEKMKELFESGVQPEWATLRYFALTPDGVPRFPVVIDWGTGQRED